MRTRVLQGQLAVTVAVLALVTACGSSTASSGAPPPERAPAEPAATGLRSAEPSGPYDLALTDVRASEHGDRTRVVLTFEGTGTAGWAARYVDEAVLEGSGDVASLGGASILRLDVTGTPTMPDRDVPITTEPGGDVVDLLAIAAWEGASQVFLGLAGEPASYDVRALAKPSRIVVDLG